MPMLPLSKIYAPQAQIRPLNNDAVTGLARSLEKLGLRSAITVRPAQRVRDGKPADVWEIVAGCHRVEAAKRLGWTEIEAIVFDGDETAARLWALSENLHRSDLTAVERSDHIAEWVRLTGAKLSQQPAQLAPVNKGGRGADGMPKMGGINAAVRDLGIDRTEAQRAVKIASLAPKAKEAAREAGLDNNQSALLAAAKQPTPQAQIAHLEEEARRRQDAAVAREDARRRLQDTEEAHRLNQQHDKAIRLTVEQQFAEWLMDRIDPSEIDTVISWLQAVKNAGVIAAMRRKAA